MVHPGIIVAWFLVYSRWLPSIVHVLVDPRLTNNQIFSDHDFFIVILTVWWLLSWTSYSKLLFFFSCWVCLLGCYMKYCVTIIIINGNWYIKIMEGSTFTTEFYLYIYVMYIYICNVYIYVMYIYIYVMYIYIYISIKERGRRVWRGLNWGWVVWYYLFPVILNVVMPYTATQCLCGV